MKKQLYLLLVLPLIWTSCGIDDDVAFDSCVDVFVDAFELTQTSENAVPYLAFEPTNNVVFINAETEEEAVFKVTIFNSPGLTVKTSGTCTARFCSKIM